MHLGLLIVEFLFAAEISLTGCERGYSKDEVQTAISPSRNLEAVVYEINGGATTSFGYEIGLRKVGNSKIVDVAELYGALLNEGGTEFTPLGRNQQFFTLDISGRSQLSALSPPQ